MQTPESPLDQQDVQHNNCVKPSEFVSNLSSLNVDVPLFVKSPTCNNMRNQYLQTLQSSDSDSQETQHKIAHYQQDSAILIRDNTTSATTNTQQQSQLQVMHSQQYGGGGPHNQLLPKPIYFQSELNLQKQQPIE